MIRRVFGVLAVALIGVPFVAVHAADSGPKKDRECIRQCRQQYRTCVDAARMEFRMCAQSTCSAEISAVKDACESDPQSEACATARQALRMCLQPCFSALRDSVGTCRTTAQACAAQCPDEPPPPTPGSKDPFCVLQCRLGLGSCLGDARGIALRCANQCSDEVAAARQACADGRSAACRVARQAAYECLEACGKALREATNKCLDAARDCVGNCPDRQPTPRPQPPRP